MHDLDSRFPPRGLRLLAHYDVPDGEHPSEAVVAAAESAGIDPETADSRLWDAIAGDGLDVLFRALDADAPREGGLVVFPLWGRVVVTDAETEVRIYEPEV